MVSIDIKAEVLPTGLVDTYNSDEFYFDIERIRVFSDCFYLFGITDDDDCYESHALTIDINGKVVPIEDIEFITDF